MIGSFDKAVDTAKNLLKQGFNVSIEPAFNGDGWTITATVDIKEAKSPGNSLLGAFNLEKAVHE